MGLSFSQAGVTISVMLMLSILFGILAALAVIGQLRFGMSFSPFHFKQASLYFLFQILFCSVAAYAFFLAAKEEETVGPAATSPEALSGACGEAAAGGPAHDSRDEGAKSAAPQGASGSPEGVKPEAT